MNQFQATISKLINYPVFIKVTVTNENNVKKVNSLSFSGYKEYYLGVRRGRLFL